MRIQVLMVDDHAILRAGLRMLLEDHSDLEVVGEVASGREAIEFLSHSTVDVVLLDLMLRGETALDVLPKIQELAPRARIIILTGSHDNEMHRQVVVGGAHGLVLKDHAFDVLHKAIGRVHAGEIWVDRALMAQVLAGLSKPTRQADPEATKIATLSPRELEIITLIGEGLPNKMIAERLFLSQTTVRHHLTSIFQKLGVNDRLELVIYAYRYNLCTIKRDDDK